MQAEKRRGPRLQPGRAPVLRGRLKTGIRRLKTGIRGVESQQKKVFLEGGSKQLAKCFGLMGEDED